MGASKAAKLAAKITGIDKKHCYQRAILASSLSPSTALDAKKMKNTIKKKLKFPLIYFHGNCGKVCPTYSDFVGLSRSTRCGCDRKHYCKNL
jgi:hypothetical protein